MDEIVTLRGTDPLKDWKSAFVAAVVRLCPDINPDSVDEASDVEFCEGVDPSLAATCWVDKQGSAPPAHVAPNQEWHPLDADEEAA